MFKLYKQSEIIDALNASFKSSGIKPRAVSIASNNVNNGQLVIEGSKSTLITCSVSLDENHVLSLFDLNIKSFKSELLNVNRKNWSLDVKPRADRLVDLLADEMSDLDPINRIAAVQCRVKATLSPFTA